MTDIDEGRGAEIAPHETLIDPDTLAAYAGALFRIDEPGPIPFEVGRPAPALDALMRSRGHRTMAFVTPYNPGGIAPEEENAANLARMVEENRAAGLSTLAGRGGCQGGEWPPEMSQAIFDVSEQDAAEIGGRWRQDAIVWHEIGGAPRLMLLR